MKKLYSLLALLLFSAQIAICQKSTTGFYVKGKIIPKETDTAWVPKVYLLKISTLDQIWSVADDMKVDSADINSDGSFIFNRSSVIDKNTFYRIHVLSNQARSNEIGVEFNMVGTSQNYAYLFLNPTSQIEFTTELSHFNDAFQGTKLDEPNRLLRKLYAGGRDMEVRIDYISPRLKQLRADTTASLDTINKLRGEMEQLFLANAQRNKLFSDTTHDPYITVFAAMYYDFSRDSAYAAKMSKRYEHEIPDSKYTTQFKSILKEIFYTLPVNSEAPEFVLTDKNGKIVKLSDFKGQFVLIDFWASWCAPCRIENRETVKPLYEKYSQKNFTVLSISVDKEKDKWLNAVSKDGLSWKQVSDLKGFESPVAKQYKVSSVPTTYLINKEGRIIAKNVSGPVLADMISKAVEKE